MAQQVKKSACNAGDWGNMGLIHGLGRSPGGGNGNPFQYSCLKNPMDRGAWWATVHGITKSQAQLRNWAHTHTHTHTHTRVLPVHVLSKYLFPFCNLQHTWAHTQKEKKRRNGSSYKLNMFLKPRWKKQQKNIIAFSRIIHKTNLNKQWWCY